MRIWISLLFCCASVWSGAQSPQFLHYGLADGLPSNLIYCIEQDRTGMIWLGTDNGLARFNGDNFRNYQVFDGIPDPEVLNLKMDIDGRMWVSCFRKSACYYQNGRFLTEKTDTVLNGIQFTSAINDLFIDTASGVWFTGTDRNIYQLYQSKVRHFKSAHPVHKVGKIGNDMFALSRACVSKFNPANGSVDTLVNLYAQYDTTYRLEGIGIAGKRILYSTNIGLWLFEWDGRTMRQIDHKDYPAGSVFVDKLGRFWLGTNKVGAICFDNREQGLFNPKYYLQDHKITNMFQDREGSIWFGTTGNGVFIMPAHYSLKYTQKEGLPLNNITALYKSADGTLLAGDEEGNLIQIAQGKITAQTLIPRLSYNRVRHIKAIDEHSQLIVADYGVFLRSENTIHQISTRASAKAGFIRADTLWVGSSTILETANLKTRRTKTKVNRRVTALAVGADGTVWMAGVDGLYSSRDSFMFNFATDFPDLKCRITALENDGPDELLLGTSDAGLLCAHIHNGGVVSVIKLNIGASQNPPQIRSIFRDHKGVIWMATPLGVYSLSPEGKKNRISTYQGLIDNDVNAVWVGQDTLWAATRFGLGVVPLRTQQNKLEFDVCFTKLQYKLHREERILDLYDAVRPNHTIVLPDNASMVDIEVAALEYTGAGIEYVIEERQGLLPWYQWTLSNLMDWSYWRGNTPTLVVSTPQSKLSMGASPQPGVYQFLLCAITDNNISSRNQAMLSITILPKWHQILWVWVILILLIIFAIWRYLRTYTQVKALDSAVANLQLQALQAQINPHFLGNSVNAIQQFFYPPNPAKASEYVGILTDLLRKTMAFSERHFIRFEEELAYDREYLQLIELRYGEQFHFRITGAENIPPQTPFPAMLIQTLLENATIHGLARDERSELHLDFENKNGLFISRVVDNGIGINTAMAAPRPDGRKSKGLELMRKKIETLNRLYHIQIELEIQDRSSLPEMARGTKAELLFRPASVPALQLGHDQK